MKPTFFATPAKFRAWLERNHDKVDELLVGFYKKDSGKPSITWPESVDEALSFGWIDGVRRRIDDDSYSIRFTPRRKGSIWSAVNINRAEELKKSGRMHAAGLRAYEARDEAKSRVYSFENAPRELPPEYEKAFRANKKAWKFFSEQPPGYRRLMIFRITSGKKEETRVRRLQQLIDASAEETRMGIEKKPKD